MLVFWGVQGLRVGFKARGLGFSVGDLAIEGVGVRTMV